MASLQPAQTLPLILILLAILAPGAAGLCHPWRGWEKVQRSRQGHCAFQVLKGKLVWLVGGRGW